MVKQVMEGNYGSIGALLEENGVESMLYQMGMVSAGGFSKDFCNVVNSVKGYDMPEELDREDVWVSISPDVPNFYKLLEDGDVGIQLMSYTSEYATAYTSSLQTLLQDLPDGYWLYVDIDGLTTEEQVLVKQTMVNLLAETGSCIDYWTEDDGEEVKLYTSKITLVFDEEL